MAQAAFDIRKDDELKKNFDMMCNDFGMSMSTAITLFAKSVVRERRIPFEIASSAPFYSKAKQEYLSKPLADYKL